jgi:hypothetical protein
MKAILNQNVRNDEAPGKPRRAKAGLACLWLRRVRLGVCLWLVLATCRPASALTFVLTYDPDSTFTTAGLSSQDIIDMKAAVTHVASVLSAAYNDPIHVNITITASPAAAGKLGESLSYLYLTTYTDMRASMVTDSTGADDTTALGTGGSVPTSDPKSSGHWVVTRAQAKALALTSDDAVTTDGTFKFYGSTFTYDPANRAVTNKYDFIGVAFHEFTEIMGRIYLMDQTVTFGSPVTHCFMLLDLFHFTGAGTHSYTTGANRYFSINNGTTNLKAFHDHDANGGDAQDYASGANDAFNAISSISVKNDLTEVGLRNMEVIGYNRAAAVWVDFAFGGSSTGTYENPYKTMADGRDNVTAGGVVNVKGPHTSATAAVSFNGSKAMRLQAAGGTVHIGP